MLVSSSSPEPRSESQALIPVLRKSQWPLVRHPVENNLHSAKQMSLFLHKSSKLQLRPSSVNHILQSHVPLLSPLIEKCKSPAEPLVTLRQTLASHSSAQTSPPWYLEITKCEIRIRKALILIEHVCRIQNNTSYLLHIHAARRQTFTGLALQIWSCAFIWMEITGMNVDWIEVKLYVSHKEHFDNFPRCKMYVLLWCFSIERNMKDCQTYLSTCLNLCVLVLRGARTDLH